jgi:glycosyltransferase involved in cell wall biosynthesis
LNPDAAIAAEWIPAHSLAARSLEVLSRFSFRHSHKVIALDRFMRDRVVAKGIPAEKIEVIPPWAQNDVAGWDPSGRERYRQKHGLQGRFVVMYSGNHSPCHPLDTLLEAAKRLANEPRFAFCFVGGGSQHAATAQFARDHGLTNIFSLPYSPIEELSGSLSAADLHVVAMGNPFVGMIHPCKVYNVLLVGAPILYLGPAQSHVGDLFREVHDPAHLHSVRHGDVESMVSAIRRAEAEGTRGHPEKYAEAVDRVSASRLLERTLDLLEGTTTGSNPVSQNRDSVGHSREALKAGNA